MSQVVDGHLGHRAVSLSASETGGTVLPRAAAAGRSAMHRVDGRILHHDVGELVDALAHRLERRVLVGLDGAAQPCRVSCLRKEALRRCGRQRYTVAAIVSERDDQHEGLMTQHPAERPLVALAMHLVLKPSVRSPVVRIRPWLFFVGAAAGAARTSSASAVSDTIIERENRQIESDDRELAEQAADDAAHQQRSE